MHKLMKEKTMQLLKERIWEACMARVQQRIEEALAAMERAAEASLAEEKSSAGDKYETGRAMGNLDRERYATILEQAKKELKFYHLQKPAKNPLRVEPGVLLEAEGQLILLATGIGKLELEGHTVLVVSALSPLGQKLRGLKAGDAFTLSERHLHISTLT